MYLAPAHSHPVSDQLGVDPMFHAHRSTPALAVIIAAATLQASSSTSFADEGVYQGLLQSTAWIVARTDTGIQTGSGVLVDTDNRLVVTNMHVINNAADTVVFFPLVNEKGLVTDRQEYIKNAKTVGIKGKVISANLGRDLALIQLEKLPDEIPAVPLAEKSPSPGQTVHSIGSPGATDALWAYTSGTVRAVYNKSFKTKLGKHKFRVLETQAPINSGDSGGPIVNDAGELIGIAQSMSVNARLVSYCVEVSEVREFMNGPRTAPAGALSQQVKLAGFETTRKDKTAIWFRRDSKKSQTDSTVMFALQQVDTLGDASLRRIACRVSDLNGRPSAALMTTLLDQNSRTRTGAWSVEPAGGGRYSVFFSTSVRADIPTSELKAVVNYIDQVVSTTRSLFPIQPANKVEADAKSKTDDASTDTTDKNDNAEKKPSKKDSDAKQTLTLPVSK